MNRFRCLVTTYKTNALHTVEVDFSTKEEQLEFVDTVRSIAPNAALGHEVIILPDRKAIR
jgi:hypothetical protein